MKAVKVLAEAVKVEAQTNPIKLDSWDSFKHDGVIALEGFIYIGKLSFICFGPTSKFFASTLAMGGQSNRTVEEKRNVQRRLSVKLIRKERTWTGRLAFTEE